MSKYIDADRLRKEVKSLERAAHKSALSCADSETRKFYEGIDFAYQHIGVLIDSLQQEQPEADLEEEIEAYFKDWSMNSYDAFFNEDGYKVSMLGIKNIARHFAKWGAEHLKK